MSSWNFSETTSGWNRPGYVQALCPPSSKSHRARHRKRLSLAQLENKCLPANFKKLLTRIHASFRPRQKWHLAWLNTSYLFERTELTISTCFLRWRSVAWPETRHRAVIAPGKCKNRTLPLNGCVARCKPFDHADHNFKKLSTTPPAVCKLCIASSAAA